MVAVSLVVFAIFGCLYGAQGLPKECNVTLCLVYPWNGNISSDLRVNFKNLTLIIRRTEHKTRMNKLLNEGCKLKTVSNQTTNRLSPLRVEERKVTGLFFFHDRWTGLRLFELSTKHISRESIRHDAIILAIDPFNSDVYYSNKQRTFIKTVGKRKKKFSKKGASDFIMLYPGKDKLIFGNMQSGLFTSKRNFRSKLLLIAPSDLDDLIFIKNVNGLQGTFHYLLTIKGKCKIRTLDSKWSPSVPTIRVPKHFCKRSGSSYMAGSILYHCGQKLTAFDLANEGELLTLTPRKKCSRCVVHGQSILCTFYCIADMLCRHVMMYNSKGDKMRTISIPDTFRDSQFLEVSVQPRKKFFREKVQPTMQCNLCSTEA